VVYAQDNAAEVSAASESVAQGSEAMSKLSVELRDELAFI